ARSLARRGVETDRTPRELIRDLADPAFWAASDWRSNYRREVAERPLQMGGFTPRRLALPALLIAAGVLTVEVARSGPPNVADGLKVDGIVGPATRAALTRHAPPAHRAAPAGHHGLKHGPAVARLQHALGVPADGILGHQSMHALRAFQKDHGLKVDGVAGPV